MLRNFRSFVALLLSFWLYTPALLAQQLADILWSSSTFDDKIAEGEAYFRVKHPGVSFRDLSTGANRDSEYVKFMRWQHFWKRSLNPDGTLGDISAYGRSTAKKQGMAKSAASLYQSVPWTNISYENYIISQIGLGRTTSIAFHPSNANIFYVGAAIGGIWKTTDGGQSYTPLGDDLPFMAVSSIIVNKANPNVLYIAISDHLWVGPPGIGVYKSVNGGATWQPTALSFNFSDDIQIYWMEADPANPSTMFVATAAGLYRTNDGFVSVTKVNSIASFDVKIKPGNSSIVYQGGQDGAFYRSIDGGINFSLIKDFGNGDVYIATTSLNASKVYVRNGTTLHKSTDSGASFSASTNALPEANGVLVFSPANQNVLLTGNFETQRSDNDGVSFYATSQWLGAGSLPLIHVDQRNIFFNPLEPDYVYYCNDGGVYRYIISTNSFENLSDGLKITQFYDIAVAQTDVNVIGGGSQDNGNVFRESNGTWYDYAPTGDGMNQEIDPTDANTRYWAYQNGAMRRWVNGVNTGISPPGKDGQGAWETPFRLDPNNPSRLIAGYNTVYESLNKGTTWANIGGVTSFGGNLEEIAISKSNSNRIYAARALSLFVKDVSQNLWTTKTLPGTISDLEVDPSDMNIVYISIPGFSSGSKVYKSVNAGDSWINISGSIPNISVGAIEVYESIPGALFIGTDAGVYYKDPSLPDWQQYGELPNTRVEDIEIQYASKLIRVGTHGRGVLEAPIVLSTCDFGAPDGDNDGVCDAYDACPALDNTLIGQSCDDHDASTTGEKYGNSCTCEGGIPNANFCAAAGSPGTGGDWIERVSLQNLNKISGYSAYSNFKGDSATLGAAGDYPLTVDLNDVFPLDKIYAWVDTNRNGTFAESERVAMSALDGNGRSTGTVSVPANIGFSPATMRVRSIYADPNNPDPCGNYYGEVEDYTLRFTYCDAAGHFGTGSDWISNVKFHTIDQDSTQTFYSDFKDVTAEVARGSSYPIEVQLNYAFDLDSVFAWIDFDQDGQFEDVELTNLSKPANGFHGTAQGSVAIPASAVPGKTVMRVRAQYAEVNDPVACGATHSGEVEDYEINIGYCAAKGADGTGDDWINRVIFNTIDNISGKSAYSDFKQISTDLTRGATYPVDVHLNYTFEPDSVYVWIDYDKDGEFEDQERTAMSDPAPGSDGNAHGLVSVPESAHQGETIMRVRAVYSETNDFDSCGDYWGEVEDYTVNLGYCGASGAEGTTADWISNVKLNTINHASAQSAYSNFKDNSTVLYLNNSYELETTINYAFDLDKVHAWIDYNQDGSFTTDERITMSDLPADSSGTSQGTIDVSPDTPLGETTLRVRIIYSDLNPNPADPCHSYFGEVEDYTIIFSNTPPEELILKDGFEQ